MNSFKNENLFKKEALAVAVKFASSKDLRDLNKVFSQVDTDHKGFITTEEIEKTLESLGEFELEQQEIKAIIESLDIHHNKIVNYSEFIASIIDKKKFLTKEKLWATFKFFDKENCGFIHKDNLRKALFYLNTCAQLKNNVLEEELIDEEVDAMLKEVSP